MKLGLKAMVKIEAVIAIVVKLNIFLILLPRVVLIQVPAKVY